jgi:hypothetical protein
VPPDVIPDALIDQCVACGSTSWAPEGTWLRYQLAVCTRCGATFTRNPDYSTERYAAAYAGDTADPVVPEEHGFVYLSPLRRLELETIALVDPPPRLTPAQRLSLRWLRARAPRGATVIDCGCGSGLFLRALRKAGIRGVGVEVSRPLVRLLVDHGLEAFEGAAPDFPWTGDRPFALTFFDVLEHFPEPSRIIGGLAGRFPGAAILASVPSPTRANLLLYGERGLSDRPPNHFVRWTPSALEIFFRGQGFRRATVRVPAPSGSELLPGLGQLIARLHRRTGIPAVRAAPGGPARGPAPRSVSPAGRRILVTVFLWLHKGYQVGADILGALAARRAHARGASASSMLVIAE